MKLLIVSSLSLSLGIGIGIVTTKWYMDMSSEKNQQEILRDLRRRNSEKNTMETKIIYN